jgi:antitoxin ParD1/3/4
MTTMNISLPDAMKEFVDAQVCERGYSTSSEYVRDLIRCDQVKQAEQRLAVLLREGLESGDAIPVGGSYWDDKREAFLKRHSSQ